MVSTQRKPRIAYITTIPLTQWLFLQGQNDYMSEAGFELHAICSPGEYLNRLVIRDGVIPHEVYISREIALWSDLKSLWRLVRVLRDTQPDIVHLSTPKAALLGAVASWLTRVPARIFFVRGSITENGKGWRRTLYWAAELVTDRLCHETLAVSPSLLEFLQQNRIARPKQSSVLGSGMSNGIEVLRFDPDVIPVDHSLINDQWDAPSSDGSRLVIGFVGRLAKDKGIGELAQAWDILRGEFPDLHLLLLGRWESEDPVDPNVRSFLECQPGVVLPGHVDDVLPYYRVMSVFAFPSHGTEGLPNAPMEAAAMGLPVVATNVIGSVDAVVPGVTGELVERGSASQLAAGLRIYLSAPQRAADHGAAGRQRVINEFQRERIWSGMLERYRQHLLNQGFSDRTLPQETIELNDL